jgi:hypothetical protein
MLQRWSHAYRVFPWPARRIAAATAKRNSGGRRASDCFHYKIEIGWQMAAIIDRARPIAY